MSHPYKPGTRYVGVSPIRQRLLDSPKVAMWTSTSASINTSIGAVMNVVGFSVCSNQGLRFRFPRSRPSPYFSRPRLSSPPS